MAPKISKKKVAKSKRPSSTQRTIAVDADEAEQQAENQGEMKEEEEVEGDEEEEGEEAEDQGNDDRKEHLIHPSILLHLCLRHSTTYRLSLLFC